MRECSVETGDTITFAKEGREEITLLSPQWDSVWHIKAEVVTVFTGPLPETPRDFIVRQKLFRLIKFWWEYKQQEKEVIAIKKEMAEIDNLRGLVKGSSGH